MIRATNPEKNPLISCLIKPSTLDCGLSSSTHWALTPTKLKCHQTHWRCNSSVTKFCHQRRVKKCSQKQVVSSPKTTRFHCQARSNSTWPRLATTNRTYLHWRTWQVRRIYARSRQWSPRGSSCQKKRVMCSITSRRSSMLVWICHLKSTESTTTICETRLTTKMLGYRSCQGSTKTQHLMIRCSGWKHTHLAITARKKTRLSSIRWSGARLWLRRARIVSRTRLTRGTLLHTKWCWS